MAYAAADVPDRIDVLINGQAYMFEESQDSLGESSYSPLFVDRQNTQGDYGDNKFDFWLTYSQNDWSLGAFQRHIDVNDRDSGRSFWQGKQIDTSRAGEVHLNFDVTSDTSAASVSAATSNHSKIAWATATRAYTISSGATETDLGAHDLSGVLSIAIGPGDDIFCTTNVGTGSVRRWTTGTTWEEWSGTECSAIAYHNNAMYGFDSVTRNLYSFSTLGVATTLHTFQEADAGSFNLGFSKLVSSGGNLLVILNNGGMNAGLSDIWEYDGTGVAKVAQLPRNFQVIDAESAFGSVFLSGYFQRSGPGTAYKQAVFFFGGGQLGVLWAGEDWTTNLVGTAVTSWDNRLWWQVEDEDLGVTHIVSYLPTTGKITQEGLAPHVSNDHWLEANRNYMAAFVSGSTAIRYYPSTAGTTVSTGFIKTSLFDGDSTLQKHWESVQVEFDSATDGDGGTVDVSRAFNTLADGSYVSVKTTAVSGTEYKIDAASREISLKITLNKGTSTLGPVLKAVRVRGAPINPSFRKERYVLNLHSVDGVQPQKLRDGTLHPLDGLAQATNLRTAFTSGDDFSVTDEFGTYNAVFEPNGLRIIRTRSQEYIAIVELRES